MNIAKPSTSLTHFSLSDYTNTANLNSEAKTKPNTNTNTARNKSVDNFTSLMANSINLPSYNHKQKHSFSQLAYCRTLKERTFYDKGCRERLVSVPEYTSKAHTKGDRTRPKHSRHVTSLDVNTPNRFVEYCKSIKEQPTARLK